MNNKYKKVFIMQNRGFLTLDQVFYEGKNDYRMNLGNAYNRTNDNGIKKRIIKDLADSLGFTLEELNELVDIPREFVENKLKQTKKKLKKTGRKKTLSVVLQLPSSLKQSVLKAQQRIQKATKKIGKLKKTGAIPQIPQKSVLKSQKKVSPDNKKKVKTFGYWNKETKQGLILINASKPNSRGVQELIQMANDKTPNLGGNLWLFKKNIGKT